MCLSDHHADQHHSNGIPNEGAVKMKTLAEQIEWAINDWLLAGGRDPQSPQVTAEVCETLEEILLAWTDAGDAMDADDE